MFGSPLSPAVLRPVRSIGLILRFRLNPFPRGLNHADHGLATGMNVNVLYRDLLYALPAVAIQRVEHAWQERAGELARLL
jgi:hypothetical protein